MKHKKKFLLFFTLLLFILNSFNLVMAEGQKIYDFAEFVEEVKVVHNVEFTSPQSIFKVIVNEGQEDMREIGEVGPEVPVPYDHSNDPDALNKMPIAARVKPGDKLSLIDLSVLGSGNKFIEWDWQVHSYFWDGTSSEFVSDRIRQNIEITVPDKEGSMFIFLNAADNYNKIPKFKNYTQYGNFKSSDVKIMENNPNIIIKGWPFTAMKLEIRKDQSDLVLKNLKLIDPETNEVLEEFTRNITKEDPFGLKSENRTMTSKKPEEAWGGQGKGRQGIGKRGF